MVSEPGSYQAIINSLLSKITLGSNPDLKPYVKMY
jgi:hypothetical protein